MSFIAMEPQVPFFQAFFTLVVFFFIVISLVSKSKPKNSTINLPPGPRKLPIIGNFHNLAGSLPHQSLRDLAKKYGPLMHLQLGQVTTIVVSSPEMAKEVMKTHDTIFANRPALLGPKIMTYNLNDIAFSPYGNYWRQLRRICVTQLLSTSRVKSFRSIREEEVRNLIESISESQGSPINLTKKIFSMIHGIVSRAAFGDRCKDQEKFISIVGQSSKLCGGFCLADLYPSIEVLQLISGLRLKMEKLHKEVDRILGVILNEHRERNLMAENEKDIEEATGDLVDVLLKLQKNGELEFPLTDNSIKAVILDIFSAGGDTSSTTTIWAMAEMLKNPRVMKKAQVEVRQVYGKRRKTTDMGEQEIEEMKFLQAVVKETLRLHPPASLLIPRESHESCVINGYEIPTNARVLVNAWAIGRDPNYWKEAERFYPERFLDSPIDYKGKFFEYIPFGGGRRLCPGMSFAVSAVELPLAQLLYNFDWKLYDGQKPEDLDMTETFGLACRRKQDLILIPVSYHPSAE